MNRYTYAGLPTAASLLLIALISAGQTTNKPVAVSQVAPPVTATPAPLGYSSSVKINYIRTREMLAPYTDPADIDNYLFDPAISNTIRETISYVDGLGRPIQQVKRLGAPNGTVSDNSYRDVITPVIYDNYGREIYKYLPYNTAVGGGFTIRPFTEQAAFFGNPSFNPDLAGEQVYYSKTIYEPSPLNRVIKTFGPGNSWAGSENPGAPATEKATHFAYLLNNPFDLVRLWTVTNNSLTYANNDETTNIPATATVYQRGELFKNVVIDEAGNVAVEYKDKEGQIILTKAQIGNTIPADYSGHDDWLCTYYIYDRSKLLRFVIPPKAVAAIKSNWVLGADVIKELCFRYEYDDKRRMIAKKAPGAGWVYMVYDNRDRQIFTQDANLKQPNQWMATLYDGLNRSVMTGVISYAGNRQALQDYADSLVAGNTMSLEGVIITGIPFPPGHNFTALTISYYDHYAWNAGSNKQFTAADNARLNSVAMQERYLENFPSMNSLNVTGLVTGTKVRVLEDPANLQAGAWLTTVNFYDDKARLIQVQSDNYKGGLDITSTRYDFAGLACVTYRVHHNPAAGGYHTRIRTTFTYGQNDELQSIKKQLDDNGEDRFTVRNSYSSRNLPQSKTWGRSLDPGTYFVSDYAYNIRRWLTGINNYQLDPVLLPGYPIPDGTRWFGMQLHYDWGFDKNQYNSNVAGIEWVSRGDGEKRAYGFGYDKMNRLLYADFNQSFGGIWAKNDPASSNYTINFTAVMGNGVDPQTAYDENGNIKAMKQYGLKLTTSDPIDDLVYNYQFNGSNHTNKLLNVIDAVNDANTQLGDFRTSTLHPQQSKTTATVDYTYDENGNMIKDLNKDMGNNSVGGIVYNHLNLPYKVTIYNTAGVKGTITYIYDASGTKLEKRVQENGQPERKTTYIGSFVYENDKLQSFAQEEGRIRVKETTINNQPVRTYHYDYFLKDHLGNVRMVLTEERPVHIYPIATLENGNAVALESTYYGITTGNILDKAQALGIPNYQNHNGIATNNPMVDSAANSTMIYRLNGSNANSKMGLGITLKVMSGDTVNILGRSYWKTAAGTGVPGQPSAIPLLDLLTAFVGTGVPGGKVVTGPQLNALPEVLSGLGNLLGQQSQTATRPKAYINWILFDESFRPVVSSNHTNSGISPVGLEGELTSHALATGDIKKNGYLYIYCSNESLVDVFFDNMQVVHRRGPLLEETHYYPFGLTMAGISSKAANMLPNKEQTFQEQRFDDDLSVNWISFKWRMHDPQIGRFLQTDPLSHDYRYQSPYNFSENRVTDGRELEGLEYVSIHHFADGRDEVIMDYKFTDKKVNETGGTTAGIYNAASYGPLGKGVIHFYYGINGQLSYTRWDNQRVDNASRIGNHGLYSGPGAITRRDGSFDFSFQPVDWADAIAKRHDMDYAEATKNGGPYLGYIEDTRTYQADLDMIRRVDNLIADINNPFVKNYVEGVETPWRKSSSGEMRAALAGQRTVITALSKYKKWKIDNGYTGRGKEHQFETLEEEYAKHDPVNYLIMVLLTNNKGK